MEASNVEMANSDPGLASDDNRLIDLGLERRIADKKSYEALVREANKFLYSSQRNYIEFYNRSGE